MAYLSVEDLHVAFDGRTVLEGMGFEIDRGEVYGLIGPNGAGKSTSINVVCDLLRPRQGSVTIGGRSHETASRRALGVVPQELAVYRDLTALQNLEFFGAVYGLAPADRRERAGKYLEAVGLTERADSLASELSGGMQRRLHLAAALLHEPPLLIFDEPTVGLDLEVRQRIWDLIGKLKRSGRAILLSTHHLEEAELLCTRIGIMHGGRIAVEGTLEGLRGLIPAAEAAVVESEDLDAVRARARRLGVPFRDGHDSVVLWLPNRADLRDVAEQFLGVPLTSVRVRPISLADVVREVVEKRRPPAEATGA
jgi:ABC-2 type transport system ATP-binding protein